MPKARGVESISFLFSQSRQISGLQRNDGWQEKRERAIQSGVNPFLIHLAWSEVYGGEGDGERVDFQLESHRRASSISRATPDTLLHFVVGSFPFTLIRFLRY